MRNVTMEVKGQNLIITVDLSKGFGPSKSGKTIIIASTDGPASIPAEQFKGVRVELNVYK